MPLYRAEFACASEGNGNDFLGVLLHHCEMSLIRGWNYQKPRLEQFGSLPGSTFRAIKGPQSSINRVDLENGLISKYAMSPPLCPIWAQSLVVCNQCGFPQGSTGIVHRGAPSCTVEVSECICNFISHLTLTEITYPYWDHSYSMLVKVAPGVQLSLHICRGNDWLSHVPPKNRYSNDSLAYAFVCTVRRSDAPTNLGCTGHVRKEISNECAT